MWEFLLMRDDKRVKSYFSGVGTSSNTIALREKNTSKAQRRDLMEKVRDLCAFWYFFKSFLLKGIYPALRGLGYWFDVSSLTNKLLFLLF